MTVKTDWTNGDVLTASQVSSYLANAGLDFITEVFVGDASVSEIEVLNAFSDQYVNYKVVYQNIDTSSMDVAKFQFLDGNGDPVVDDYTSSALSMSIGSATVANEGYSYMFFFDADSQPKNGQFDIFNPYVTDYTFFCGDAFTTNYYRRIGGKYYMQESFTSFRLVGDAGTFQYGSIAVYGYRLT